MLAPRSSRPGALPLPVAALLASVLTGCGGSSGFVPPPAGPAPLTRLGDPIPGCTPEELAAFERGRLVFERRFTPSEGLGPFYNATSCQSCHSNPVTGGSARLYRNFRLGVWGTSTPQQTLAPFLSPVVPAFGSGALHATTTTFTLEGGRALVPETVGGTPVVAAHRNGLAVFGVGLFEFVADETIVALADPDDLDGDGISGRFNRDLGEIGKFGVKAQSRDIVRFTRAPLQNQMGITTNPFMEVLPRRHGRQVSANPDDPTIDHDPAPDPEISNADLADLVAFMRFLAPPAPRPFDDAAARGEQRFDEIGCTKCHLPSLPSPIGPIRAFTDLLLHDMGPGLADGIRMGVTQPSLIDPAHTGNEFRTQPLWGVSMSGPFLHDGRAATLREAIGFHGGEAAVARDAFFALSPAEQADLIAFLEHL
jgi:CxxC motif-containing protein (DUF1111 family)